MNDPEGDVAQPPFLPPEAVKMGITVANAQAAGTGKYPQQYWANGMQAGDWRIVSGVIHEHQPNGNRAKVLLAGFAKEEQPDVDLSPPAEDDPDPEATALARKKALAGWFAKHYGQGLKSADQKALEANYLASVDAAHKISKDAPTYKTAQANADAKAALAKVASDLLVAEQKVFAAAPVAAQVKRYGRELPQRTPPNPVLLQKKVDQFLQAKYMNADYARARMSRPAISAAVLDRVVRASTIEFSSGLRYTTEYDWLGNPEIIGYEGRCFVAEHDAENVDWDQWGIPGIYHTSIIAGMWRIERQRRRVNRFSRASDNATAPPQLIESREEIVTQAKFAGWRVGNGAASTYDQADTLRQFYQCSGPSWESVDRILFGYTPTQGGKYYPIRGVAYSVGNYGIHWVCHQTANAFCVRRWAISPVTYLASILLHNMYGNKGISEREDYLKQIHRGCVPGVNCFYNIVPPYSIPEPITVAVMEAGMSGAGYLLDKLWNQKKAKWINSEADFDSVAVPCQAHDDVISIDRV